MTEIRPVARAVPTDDSVEDIYDDAPCGFASTTADGTVIRVNRTLSEWVGREVGAMVGAVTFDSLLTPGSRSAWLHQHVPQLTVAGRLGAVVVELDQGPRPAMSVLLTASLVDRPDLEGPLVRLTLLDARERLAVESRLLAAQRAAERAQWRTGALQHVTEAAAAATSVRSLFAAVAVAVSWGFTATGASVWTRDGTRGGLVLAASHDLPDYPTLLGSPGHPSYSAWRAWETGSTLHCPASDPTTDLSLRAELAAADSGSLVAVPLTYDDAFLGVVVVYLPVDLTLDAEDVHTIEVIGTIVGQAVARARMQEGLQRRAEYDDLTGFAKRSLLESRLRAIVAEPRGADGDPSTALLFIDLDDFKTINDTHGHDVGDRVLVACARRISSVVREGDAVARTGGDEFVVLCEGADLATAEQVAARVRAVVDSPISVDHLELRVGASVGVAASDDLRTWADVRALMERADAAMYQVKQRRGSSGATGS